MRNRFQLRFALLCMLAMMFPAFSAQKAMAQEPARRGEGGQAGEGGTPFVPLQKPRFVKAEAATFLKDSDRVVGVSENGEAKAYEPDVTAWHHVVQDRIGDMPVIVTWCSLCNTPLVYRSDVDGKVLTFARAGNRGNNFFMADAETGSHWQQIGGECFEGPMKGKRLTMVPFLYTTWGEWRAQHPQTVVLVPEPQYKDQYAMMAKRIASISYGSNRKPDRELVREADPRLPNYEQVIGIRFGGATKAYPTRELRKTPVVNDELGGKPLVVVYSPASDTTTAFSRTVDGRTLTFHESPSGGLTDAETGSTWSPYGLCTAGKLKGKKLAEVIPEPGFWFAWAEFNPGTEVYSGAARK